MTVTLEEAVDPSPQKRSWDALVIAGIQANSDRAWTLGDLANEVATGYGEASLRRYAGDIEVEYDTLKDFRRVARAYPEKGDRSPFSWTLCQIFASQSDRLELLAQRPWTTAQARKLIRSRNKATLPPKPPSSPTPPPGGRPKVPPQKPRTGEPPPATTCGPSIPSEPEEPKSIPPIPGEDPRLYEACTRAVMAGKPMAQVARDEGISEDSRPLTRAFAVAQWALAFHPEDAGRSAEAVAYRKTPDQRLRELQGRTGGDYPELHRFLLEVVAGSAPLYRFKVSDYDSTDSGILRLLGEITEELAERRMREDVLIEEIMHILGDERKREQIRKLRDPMGRTPEEYASQCRMADKLEQKLAEKRALSAKV